MLPTSETVFTRYLERYAEPEARAVLAVQWGVITPASYWRAVVVVPVTGESIELLAGYRDALVPNRVEGERSDHPSERSLLVLVLNAHDGTCWEHAVANRTLRAALETEFTDWTPLCLAPLLRLARGEAFDLLLVERWQAPFLLPERGAVGLARKLGNDVALALMLRGRVRSPWLYQTDADAVLPADALQREAQLRSVWLPACPAQEGARLFAFRHVASDVEPGSETESILLATLKYEVQLRYHVLGLAWARSPYAFHALGSVIAVHARSYVQVRGFPKRAAGEDFYLLQKVKKIAPVIQMGGAAVMLRARVSSRAPFGTGPAVRTLLASPDLHLESPASYAVLAHWLQRIAAYARARSNAELGWDIPGWGFGPGATECPLHVAEHAKQALTSLGARERLEALLGEATTGADLLARAHTWFDALKTQRFLHALRSSLPLVPMSDALGRAPFTHGAYQPWTERAAPAEVGGAGIDEYRQLCKHLAQLEASLATAHETPS